MTSLVMQVYTFGNPVSLVSAVKSDKFAFQPDPASFSSDSSNIKHH